LIAAVGRFEAAEQTFLPEALSAHASQFSRSAFRDAFSRLVERKLQNFRSRRARPIDQR
jgi:hypothetical protein